MPHPLPPGEAFRVVGRSSQPGKIELVAGDSSVAVYGWPGSTLQVYNGDAMVDDFSVVFPELPPGMSPRSFVEVMFGGAGGPGSQPPQHVAETQPARARPWWQFW